MKQTFRIREFSEKHLGEGIWRVDWFGGVDRNPNVLSEPCFNVILSRLKEGNKADIASNDAVISSTRRAIKIGVGQLPLITIGSFWRNGFRLPSQAGKIKILELNINSSTTGIKQATHQVGNEILVSFKDHLVSVNGNKAWCLYVRQNDDPAAVIIPAMEVIRFYYATSSRLSKALFKGDFSHNLGSLINIKKTGMLGKRCVVCRRYNVSDRDCWIIGRILNSTEASLGVKLIHDSLIVERVENDRGNSDTFLYPKVAFPFSGKTKIMAYCKQVGEQKNRWLVLSLISCSAPFPYNELEVIDPFQTADPATDIPYEEKIPIKSFPKKTPIPENFDPWEIQSGQEPSSGWLPEHINMAESRFDVLLGKKIIKTLKKQCRYRSGELKTVVPITTAMLGTGDGAGRKEEIAQGEIGIENERGDLPDHFEMFLMMLEILDSMPDISAKLHSFQWGSGFIKATLGKASKHRQWGYLDLETKRVRRFLIADISMRDFNFCAIEVERRGGFNAEDRYRAEIFYRVDGRPLGSGEVKLIAEVLSTYQGRMCWKESPPKNVKFIGWKDLPEGVVRWKRGIMHKWSGAREYAEKLIEVAFGKTGIKKQNNRGWM